MKVLLNILSIGILVFLSASLSFAQERYRGTYEPDLFGRGGTIRLKKVPSYPSSVFSEYQRLRELLYGRDYVQESPIDFALKVKQLELLRLQIEAEKKRLGLTPEMKPKPKPPVYQPMRNPYPQTTIQSTHQKPKQPPKQPTTFKVYFKNGKELLCDRAWRNGETVFLVVHDKRVAIGYSHDEIDMEKSFE